MSLNPNNNSEEPIGEISDADFTVKKQRIEQDLEGIFTDSIDKNTKKALETTLLNISSFIGEENTKKNATTPPPSPKTLCFYVGCERSVFKECSVCTTNMCRKHSDKCESCEQEFHLCKYDDTPCHIECERCETVNCTECTPNKSDYKCSKCVSEDEDAPFFCKACVEKLNEDGGTCVDCGKYTCYEHYFECCEKATEELRKVGSDVVKCGYTEKRYVKN